MYVLDGDALGGPRVGPWRAFPRIDRVAGESEPQHLLRVARRIEEAVSNGATHLVVSQESAGWLGDHPMVAAFLAQKYELEAADAEQGLVFRLRCRPDSAFDLDVSGWRVVPGESLLLTADRRLVNPLARLTLRSPAPGPLTGSIAFKADGLGAVQLQFGLARSKRRSVQRRNVVLSLDRMGSVFHDLPYVAAHFRADGSVRLEFDLDLARDRRLGYLELGIVEEDNWRVHPTFPGGASLHLPAKARAGSRLSIEEFALEAAGHARKGPPHGIVHAEGPAPYRKPPGRTRDAVIFSSWMPAEGLVLGDYFLSILQRWHADSKIFVGVNHGSDPRWVERLRASGLDVVIAHAGPDLRMPFDPSGFVAALDAYRRCAEPFEFVWFGHTKGGDHLADTSYATGRWMIEKTFWSRRAAIEGYFANPVIGLYAPHYLMLLQEHLTQTDALRRMYQGPCAPLYVMAVSSHFVMRDESVREFCARVDPPFFQFGPEPYGGDRFFFEMAMPNVPIVQGYEPHIEPGRGGTGKHPKMTGVASILNDWRQNHAVVAFELEKWRHDPTGFRTAHREHNRIE